MPYDDNSDYYNNDDDGDSSSDDSFADVRFHQRCYCSGNKFNANFLKLGW